jgi:hypothetical protein
VNFPLIVAGSLAILGAAIHGVAGEVLVVRRLSPGMLPSSHFGGARTTKTMIHVTWHMTTIAWPARRRRVHRVRGARGGAGGCLRAIPSIPVRPPRSRHAHRHRGAGVVGSSLKTA